MNIIPTPRTTNRYKESIVQLFLIEFNIFIDIQKKILKKYHNIFVSINSLKLVLF